MPDLPPPAATSPGVTQAQAQAQATFIAGIGSALVPYAIPAMKWGFAMLFGAVLAGGGHMVGRPATTVAVSSPIDGLTEDQIHVILASHDQAAHGDSPTREEFRNLAETVGTMSGQMNTVLYLACKSAKKDGVDSVECRDQ